ncbi:HEAT repeat domain-containing protein [Terriglobus albidus]|uniref:HEAT repeat domain-containing protein n=1 Tax=Terriglobus albidus TaxID=1592106 RepID=UPI0021DF5D0A|nr:HEAT repeat domain-containing protein [Terriglobus albidus]
MKCESVQLEVVLLAYGELADDRIPELDEHLAGCEACRQELESLTAMQDTLAGFELAEPSPNLLAQARVKLDEALDAEPAPGLLARLRILVMGSLHHVKAAPALAALLVGVGFLGGSAISRYQAANAPKATPPVLMQHSADSTIANISSIVQTPDSKLVQVNYNRVVPETAQGTLDDPQIKQLLLMGAKNGISNDVRDSSVALLAEGCKAGHICDEDDQTKRGSSVRDTLLVSLRYDQDSKVRLNALHGLQRYLVTDQRVRDAVLESIMNDHDPDVRMQAINMLEPVQADSSVRQVLHTVSTTDDNPYIRNASMNALESVSQIQ